MPESDGSQALAYETVVRNLDLKAHLDMLAAQGRETHAVAKAQGESIDNLSQTVGKLSQAVVEASIRSTEAVEAARGAQATAKGASDTTSALLARLQLEQEARVSLEASERDAAHRAQIVELEAKVKAQADAANEAREHRKWLRSTVGKALAIIIPALTAGIVGGGGAVYSVMGPQDEHQHAHEVAPAAGSAAPAAPAEP